jgi:hypothetical protein
MDQTTRQQLVGEIYHYGQLMASLAQQPVDSPAAPEALARVGEQIAKIKALLDEI